MDPRAMTMAVAGFAVALTPFLLVVLALRLSAYVARRRETIVARQIALTDAIHRELGAVAAPLVEKRLGGGWLVSMVAPLDRPGTTAALVRITERVFARERDANALRIVLTPGRVNVDTGRSAGAGHLGAARPMAA